MTIVCTGLDNCLLCAPWRHLPPQPFGVPALFVYYVAPQHSRKMTIGNAIRCEAWEHDHYTNCPTWDFTYGGCRCMVEFE